MKVVSFGRTDTGKKRSLNEDHLLVLPELGLFMVCDGMGGHAAGEVAAMAAAQAVRRHIEEHRQPLDAYDDSPASRDRLIKLVDGAVQSASGEVYRIATSDRGKTDMGTTLTLLLCHKNIGVMGHVGDTRLYMLRAGQLHQLSEDHTYVHEMVRRGMGTHEELKKGPYASVITRAVGIQAHVRVDTLLLDILPDDTFLICSDGLTRYTEGDLELGRMLASDKLESIAGQLVDFANARGGTDNISALVLRAEPESGDALVESNRITEVSLRLDTLQDVALFRQLDMGELCKVLNVARVCNVARGEQVVREGEPGDAFFTILSGNFVVSRAGQLITSLRAGSHFGEMALFDNRPRSATVEATESSSILVMDRASARELVHKEPGLGVKMLWAFAQVLSQRLDDTSVQLYSADSNRTPGVSVGGVTST